MGKEATSYFDVSLILVEEMLKKYSLQEILSHYHQKRLQISSNRIVGVRRAQDDLAINSKMQDCLINNPS